MKLAGLFVNKEKDSDLFYTNEVVRSLSLKGIDYFIFPKDKAIIDVYGDKCVDELYDYTDVVISIGGDGTYLKASRLVFRKQIPLLGINLGSLGFLTDVEKNEIDSAIGYLAGKNYYVENRMMLDVEIVRNDKTVFQDSALNDIVISRGALSRILHLKTYVNNTYADLFPGDGLIVSTPTGSTAYSLSAGGPIVEPDAELLILTPICPHLLYTRSFITDPQKVIKVVVEENNDHEAMVTVDGQTGFELKGGDVILAKRASSRVKMIKIKTTNFFSILRKKMYYRGETDI